MTTDDFRTVHPRISVSQISSWDWSLHSDLTYYADHGVRRVGLHERKLVAHGTDDAVRLVTSSGLEVTNVIAPTPLRVADRSSWPAQRDRLRGQADLAARCGAPMLCTTTGPADGLSWTEATRALEGLLEPVTDGLAVPLVLEHTNLFRVDLSFLLSLRDAVAMGRRLGVGVCAEVNTCWSEGDLGATVTDGIDVIELVQVSDFVVGTKCTADRAVVGDGDIPFTRVLGYFEQAGYRGPYDIEMIGPRLDEEGYGSALDRCVANLGQVLDEVVEGTDSPA